MDGWSKRPYTNRGTERFATSQSQGSEAEQTNRGYAEAEASQAVPAACAEHRGHGSGQVHQRPDAREQLVWVGERVGVQRHDGGFLIDDPDHGTAKQAPAPAASTIHTTPIGPSFKSVRGHRRAPHRSQYGDGRSAVDLSSRGAVIDPFFQVVSRTGRRRLRRLLAVPPAVPIVAILRGGSPVRAPRGVR